MKIIYPEFLFQKFFKKLSPYYILIGNLEFLVMTSKKIILTLAKKNGFKNCSIIELNDNVTVNNPLQNFQLKNFICNKNIILITLRNPNVTKDIIQRSLLQLAINSLNNNILLIIHIKTMIPDNIWINIFKKPGTIIHCHTVSHKQLEKWIVHKTEEINLKLTINSIKTLLKNYHGNILNLCNIINILSLIWPKKTISTLLIKKIIYNLSIFTPAQWIDALLINDFEHSINIINQFITHKISPIILIRCLQYDLINVLLIKRSQLDKIKLIFIRRKIWKNRQQLLVNFSKNKSFENINKCIKLLNLIELKIKTCNSKFIWLQLKTLIKIICHNY